MSKFWDLMDKFKYNKNEVPKSVLDGVKSIGKYKTSDDEEFNSKEEAIIHEKKILLEFHFSREGCRFDDLLDNMVRNQDTVIEILLSDKENQQEIER